MNPPEGGEEGGLAIGTWIITIRISQQDLCMFISEAAAGVILFLLLWRNAKK